MACGRLQMLILFSCIAYFEYTQAQKCVLSAPKGLDVTTQAYRSQIVITAKVSKTSNENQTAEVTSIFPTKNGGLAIGNVIVFGPVPKRKGCKRMKKNKSYLLFLEKASASDPTYHRIMFDPVSKLSQAKKLKKILCDGCVKAPKISGRNKEVVLRENRPFTFKCKAGGNPKPMAAFFKDGEKLTQKDKSNGIKMKIKKKGGGGRLKISKVKVEHSGVYTCQAVSFAGNASLTYTLTVIKDDCVECPADKANYCINGRCCIVPVVNQTACRCEENYQGPRCNEKKPPAPRSTITIIEARYHRQTIAIMAVCISLLVVILVCYIVYCKFKKSRSHIRKEIIARNGNVGSRPVETVEDRQITNADATGILADDAGSRDIQMTGYRSTNLTTDQPQPYAFAQRPQTYDDVILTRTAAESKPLVAQDLEQTSYGERRDSRHLMHEVNGRRRRKNGVAVELAGDQSRSASDIDAFKSRRIDELKTGRDSMTSSASSLTSHHELRKPAIPLDERLASMAMSGVYRPPAYPINHHEDIPDSGHQPQQEFYSPTGAPLGRDASQHSAAHGSTSPPQSPRETTFSSEGRKGDELGRSDGVAPHFSNVSPTSLPYSLPTADQNQRAPLLASPGSESGHLSQKVKLPYQKENVGGNVYPYYEHSPQHMGMGSPSNSRHDSDDTFSGIEIPDTSLQILDPQRRGQPSNPRQYQTSPEMGMGVPLRHGPVTVASARTHHLPLLTKEKPELPSVDTDSRAQGGSTVSLSSSSSNRSSQDPKQNRNSHKIEV